MNLSQLSDKLFTELDDIESIEESGDQEKLEVKMKAIKSKVDIARMIVDISRVQLDAMKFKNEWNLNDRDMPNLLVARNA